MSKKKKIIVTIVVVLVIAAVIVGAVYAYLWQQSKSLTAEVQPVSNLNWYYGGSEMTSYGMVTNDFYQDVYLLDDQTISEIYVEEGQEVKAGDPLMAYDMTLTNLKVEMQELEVQNIGNRLILANRELEKLRNTTPIPEQPVVPEVPEVPEEKPVKLENAYNYIPSDTPVSDGLGEGTEESPYIFYCVENCYVEGGFLEALAESEEETFVKFQMFSLSTHAIVEDKANSINSSQLKNSPIPIEIDAKYDPYTLQRLPDDYGEEIDDTEDTTPEIEEPQGYTAAELAAEIKKTEKEIKDLDLQKRQAQLQLDQMKKLTEDGVVQATVDGIVKTVGDKDNPPMDGSAFITVSGSEGLYVTGYLSELQLGEVEVGQIIYANSWESGTSFEATIQEISQYPSDSSNSWGEGNPNVSYYPYTAYIADSGGLKNGEYVDLTMTATNNSGEDFGAIYLQKAYVREENGKSYVMMADEKDRLKKQYVETGKTIYGEAVEIKSGLTQEDRIAFPYGKTAKEGVKVEDGSGSGASYY